MVSFSFINAIDPTTIIFIVLLVILIIALLVVPMFTNKKRAKQVDELHRSLQPGDLIKTVGGVIGTIKEIRQISPADKEMVIETGDGDNKTTMVFDIQALYQIMSRSNTVVAAKEEDTQKETVPETEPVAEEPRVVPDIMADRVTAETEKTEVAETAEPQDGAGKVSDEIAAEGGEKIEVSAAEESVHSSAKPDAKKTAQGRAKKTGGTAKKSK